MTWLLILLAVINAASSFVANYMFNFSAFSIAPAGVIILAQKGGNIWLSAFTLVLAYGLISVDDLFYLWITLPLAIIMGYLATTIPSIAALLALYHAISAVFAFIFAYFDAKYIAYMFCHFSTNYLVGQFLALLF